MKKNWYKDKIKGKEKDMRKKVRRKGLFLTIELEKEEGKLTYKPNRKYLEETFFDVHYKGESKRPLIYSQEQKMFSLTELRKVYGNHKFIQDKREIYSFTDNYKVLAHKKWNVESVQLSDVPTVVLSDNDSYGVLVQMKMYDYYARLGNITSIHFSLPYKLNKDKLSVKELSELTEETKAYYNRVKNTIKTLYKYDEVTPTLWEKHRFEKKSRKLKKWVDKETKLLDEIHWYSGMRKESTGRTALRNDLKQAVKAFNNFKKENTFDYTGYPENFEYDIISGKEDYIDLYVCNCQDCQESFPFIDETAYVYYSAIPHLEDFEYICGNLKNKYDKWEYKY